jgi:hypothetical protein
MTWVGTRVDMGFMRTLAVMATFRTGATPVPATFAMLRGAAQSLNISRAMRESSRYSLRAG